MQVSPLASRIDCIENEVNLYRGQAPYANSKMNDELRIASDYIAKAQEASRSPHRLQEAEEALKEAETHFHTARASWGS